MKTVSSFIELYIANTNTHNFKNLEPMLHPNAVYWFDENEYTGMAAIEAAFLKAWQFVPDEVYSIKHLRWLSIDSKTAACIYVYEWEGTHHHTRLKGSGRGTNLLVKENGSWKIVHEHLNKMK